MKKIGLFGGTFDPVHLGHLAMAQELQQTLQLDQMRLLPCHLPPHRPQPVASGRQRAAMVRLTIAADVNANALSCDERELARDGLSYTIDTLIDLREELEHESGKSAKESNAKVSLILCMGMDSFNSLPSWHRWRELLNYAHIAVVARPGYLQLGNQAECQAECQIEYQVEKQPDELAEWLHIHQVSSQEFVTAINHRSAGCIALLQLSLLPISATDIRAKIAAEAGMKVENKAEAPWSSLVPAVVARYIQDGGLYRPR